MPYCLFKRHERRLMGAGMQEYYDVLRDAPGRFGGFWRHAKWMCIAKRYVSSMTL